MTEDPTPNQSKAPASKPDPLRLILAARERELVLEVEAARQESAAAMNALARFEAALAIRAQHNRPTPSRVNLFAVTVKLAERVAVLEYRLGIRP